MYTHIQDPMINMRKYGIMTSITLQRTPASICYTPFHARLIFLS